MAPTSSTNQHIENLHIAQLAIGDMEKGGDVAAQIEPRVHLHGRLGGAKQLPGKQRQTQIDGRRIQRVGGAFQFEAKALAHIELPSTETHK